MIDRPNGPTQEETEEIVGIIEGYMADLRSEKALYMNRCKPLHEQIKDTIEDAVKTKGFDKKALKVAYLKRLAEAPDDAIVVKLADRASNVQTLRNLRPQKQREYYAQTVAYIMPLAASRRWWAVWYASWQEAHRDLA